MESVSANFEKGFHFFGVNNTKNPEVPCVGVSDRSARERLQRAIQKPLVLTFYGVLIYEMSFWDKLGVISPELGDSGDRDSKKERFLDAAFGLRPAD